MQLARCGLLALTLLVICGFDLSARGLDESLGQFYKQNPVCKPKPKKTTQELSGTPDYESISSQANTIALVYLLASLSYYGYERYGQLQSPQGVWQNVLYYMTTLISEKNWFLMALTQTAIKALLVKSLAVVVLISYQGDVWDVAEYGVRKIKGMLGAFIF